MAFWMTYFCIKKEYDNAIIESDNLEIIETLYENQPIGLRLFMFKKIQHILSCENKAS